MKWLDLIKGLLNFLFGQREAGRQEQQNADMKAGEAVIQRANEAAKKIEQEESGERDPNDRDNR